MKSKENNIVLDAETRRRFFLIDKKKINYFSKRVSVITDITPYKEEIQFHPTVHSAYNMLIYTKQGSQTLQIHNKKYQLKAGHIIHIAADNIMHIRNTSEDLQATILAYQLDEEYSHATPPPKLLLAHISADDTPIIEHYFHNIAQLIQQRYIESPLSTHFICSFVSYIEHLSMREDAKPIEVDKPANTDLSQMFVNLIYIQQRPIRKLEYYAQALAVSVGYLSHRVKSDTGYSPTQWVDKYTLQYIKRALTDANHNYLLKQIAQEAQLGTESNLIRFFKKRTGMTPGAFRAQHLATQQEMSRQETSDL